MTKAQYKALRREARLYAKKFRLAMSKAGFTDPFKYARCLFARKAA